jgi:hypothetical protein
MNILSFLLPENNSHVAVPINKISSIELFLLKQGSQIESRSITGRHDLPQEINMQGFSTRLYINVLLTNLIKDTSHYVAIVLLLTTIKIHSGLRSIVIKILVSFGFTARKSEPFRMSQFSLEDRDT